MKGVVGLSQEVSSKVNSLILTGERNCPFEPFDYDIHLVALPDKVIGNKWIHKYFRDRQVRNKYFIFMGKPDQVRMYEKKVKNWIHSRKVKYDIQYWDYLRKVWITDPVRCFNAALTLMKEPEYIVILKKPVA